MLASSLHVVRRYGNRRCRRCDTKVELNWLLAGAPEQRKPIAAKGLFSFRNSTYESKHGERARLNETDRTRKIYDFNVFYVSVCVCFFRTSALWFIWFFFSFVYIACSDCMAMCYGNGIVAAAAVEYIRRTFFPFQNVYFLCFLLLQWTG